MATLNHIVFYDGDCGLCSSTVRWLIRLDKKRVLVYSPISSELCRDIVKNPAIDSIVYAQIESRFAFRAWYYSDATIQIGFTLGGIYKMGGMLLRLIPRPIRDRGYQFVARHRKQIFASECLVPTVATRTLFLYTWSDIDAAEEIKSSLALTPAKI